MQPKGLGTWDLDLLVTALRQVFIPYIPSPIHDRYVALVSSVRTLSPTHYVRPLSLTISRMRACRSVKHQVAAIRVRMTLRFVSAPASFATAWLNAESQLEAILALGPKPFFRDLANDGRTRFAESYLWSFAAAWGADLVGWANRCLGLMATIELLGTHRRFL